MSVTTKNKIPKNTATLPEPKRRFATVEEAAQAKTDEAWETVLKHVDWNKFNSMRNQK